MSSSSVLLLLKADAITWRYLSLSESLMLAQAPAVMQKYLVFAIEKLCVENIICIKG